MQRKYTWVGLLLLLAGAFYFCLPSKLFNEPYSKVLCARDGELLTASIASDGQWRFPQSDKISSKFTTALIAYEDRRFPHHYGVDALALARAVMQNLRAGKIVSGGSTISMQVIRLSRKGRARTMLEKCLEITLALRLELTHSKSDILRLYSSHAPFGGNVVGLEAACWRYFGRSSETLSWGEACLLAVLPNSPGMIHPGKNRSKLMRKRNSLLFRLHQKGWIDEDTYQLAISEPVPDSPLPLPRFARHALTQLDAGANSIQHTTISYPLQQRTEEILNYHISRLKGNHIYNAAAIVVEVATGRVISYAGNVDGMNNNSDVDMIRAPRSTGSILKPFLYAAAMDQGKILARTLVPDIPIFINGFAPKNFSKSYDGAVPASEALIRSLNVPFVHVLRQYRYEKFYTLLKQLGMTTLSNTPDHYGLSLILGGAEVNLWDLTGMYASMARALNQSDAVYPLTLFPEENRRQGLPVPYVSKLSIYNTLNVLQEVYRPGEETGWRYFNNSRRIAWKTGTSFGWRDAWAVGVTPEYAVGVWVGNADGEGRPGLTGTEAASPIMFDLFLQLPATSWFSRPDQDIVKIEVCSRSGMRKGVYCGETATQFVSTQGLLSPVCTYHRMVHLSPDLKYQVNSNCFSLAHAVDTSWFQLPPAQEFYYQSRHVSYVTLPPFKKDCLPSKVASVMELIYPKSDAKLVLPRNLDGSKGSILFQLAHHYPGVAVYWHIDDTFVGATHTDHKLSVEPSPGPHKLTLIDASGEVLEQFFQVIASP